MLLETVVEVDGNSVDQVTSLLDSIVKQFEYIWSQIVAMYEQISISLTALFNGDLT